MDTTSLAISRDAAPSSTTSSAAEDDGALSVNSGLAKEAALLFQSGKFADCCRVLHQLLQKKERDPKVSVLSFLLFAFCSFLHFVAFYISSGFSVLIALIFK